MSHDSPLQCVTSTVQDAHSFVHGVWLQLKGPCHTSSLSSFFFFIHLQTHTRLFHFHPRHNPRDNNRSSENMTTLEDKSLWETTGEEEVLGADILKANTEEIINRTRLLDNDIKVRAGIGLYACMPPRTPVHSSTMPPKTHPFPSCANVSFCPYCCT